MGRPYGEVALMDSTSEAYFNELSLPPQEGLDYDCIMADLVASLRYINEKGNIKTVRIDSDSYNQLLNLARDRNQKDLLRARLKMPFEDDDYGVEHYSEYIDHSWSFKDQSCQGLAFASIFDSLAISINQSPWNTKFIEVLRDNEKLSVRNIFDDSDAFSDYFESHKAVELITTDIPIANKNIKLRNDHGKDKLMEFSKKLVKSPYVIGVINSLPFNPKLKYFINRCNPDGTVEIVLNWTDKGLGILVQTTGRNAHETKAIAKILEEQFADN